MAKTKMTDELIDNISSAFSLGLSTRGACDYVGISEPTYYSYINKAEDEIEKGKTEEQSKYVKFFNTVKKAKAACRVFHMTQIRNAASSGNWQASAWTLERCFPDEFGRQVKVEAENGILNGLLKAIKENE